MNLPHIYHKNVHVLEGELKIVTHNELIECVLFTALNTHSFKYDINTNLCNMLPEWGNVMNLKGTPSRNPYTSLSGKSAMNLVK